MADMSVTALPPPPVTTSTTNDAIGSATKQLNSGSADRASLINGQFAFTDNLIGKSNRAYGWHKLMMELLALLKPS